VGGRLAETLNTLFLSEEDGTTTITSTVLWSMRRVDGPGEPGPSGLQERVAAG